MKLSLSTKTRVFLYTQGMMAHSNFRITATYLNFIERQRGTVFGIHYPTKFLHATLHPQQPLKSATGSNIIAALRFELVAPLTEGCGYIVVSEMQVYNSSGSFRHTEDLTNPEA